MKTVVFRWLLGRMEQMHVGIRARISGVRALCSDGLLWMKIWKTTPVLSWMKAAEAYRNGDYSKAVDYYRKGLSKYPSHPAHFSARFDLAFCLEKLGFYDEAIQEVSYLIAFGHELKEAYLLRARVQSYVGKYLNALETLKIAKKVLPGNLEILTSLFHISIDIGINLEDIEVQKLELKKLLSCINFENIDTKQDYIDIQVALSHYEYEYGDEIKADQILTKILAEGNATYRCYLVKGLSLLSYNKIIQAREQFRKALICDPQNPIPQILIAETYLSSGSQDELVWAIQLAESACRSSKWTNPDAIETLVTAYQRNSELVKVDLFSQRLKEMGNIRFILGPRKISQNEIR
jgi:tetratricopeptide (TPR) repeat protein